MTYETFKLIHSELIQFVQYIEHDLKVIYSTLKPGEYDDNFSFVENKPLGVILHEMQGLDEELGYSKIKDEDYELLDEVRNIRNYWCHRGYVDFHYIENPDEHERAFQEVAWQLHLDEERVYNLHMKMEKLRKSVVKKYKYRK